MNRTQAGAAPSVEGQRLLAQRRGPVRLWMQKNPLGINILLACTNLVYLLVTTSIGAVRNYGEDVDTSSEWEIGYFVFVSLLLTLGIFFRSRYPASLLCAAVSADLLQVLLRDESMVNEVDFSPVSGLTLAIFLYTLADLYSWRRILAVFLVCLLIDGATIVTAAYRAYIFFEDDVVDEMAYNSVRISMITTSFLLRVSMGLVIILIARQARKNRDFEAELLVTFEKNQQLAATEERSRIAREMHDVVAHSLTVMIALADGARVVGVKDPQRVVEVLGELSQTGRSALADVRHTLGVLKEAEDDTASFSPPEGGVEDATENIAELVRSFASAGLPVHFKHLGQPVPDDHNFRLSIYRIVQESLTNALRYGENMTSVEVILRVDLPDIWIRVVNDGESVSVRKKADSGGLGGGRGIAGMRERAALYGGSVEAGENSEGGWTVLAHLLCRP